MGTAFKYRFQWTFPIAISPHDHNVVYVGSQYVHRTSDAGRSWEVISPDLTLNDPKMLGPSGGLTYDNLAVELGCVVFSIAESPVEKGCIWAGTNDGLAADHPRRRKELDKRHQEHPEPSAPRIVHQRRAVPL